MPSKNETHLERKLRQLGLSTEGACPTKKCTFKLYFPKPPYHGVDYHAARTKDGFNFVGLVLGHGGTTLQRIQKQTGTKIEIQDRTGNLNGAHPAANDPTLHALVTADSKEKLTNAVEMIVAVLKPLNTSFEPLKIDINSSGTLKPIMADHLWLDSSQEEDYEHVTGQSSPNGSEEGQAREHCSNLKARNALRHTQPETQPHVPYIVQHQENGVTVVTHVTEVAQDEWCYEQADYASSYMSGPELHIASNTSFPGQHTQAQTLSALHTEPPATKGQSPQWGARSGPSLPWGSDGKLAGRLSWEYQPQHVPTQPRFPAEGGLYGPSSPRPAKGNGSVYNPLNPLEGVRFEYGNAVSIPSELGSATPSTQSSFYTYGGSEGQAASRQDLQETSDASIDHLVGLLVP